jgi:hypothetical protein
LLSLNTARVIATAVFHADTCKTPRRALAFVAELLSIRRSNTNMSIRTMAITVTICPRLTKGLIGADLVASEIVVQSTSLALLALVASRAR